MIDNITKKWKTFDEVPLNPLLNLASLALDVTHMEKMIHKNLEENTSIKNILEVKINKSK